MNNVKELAEAFQQLQKIENEILRINEIAMQAANDDMVVDVKLALFNRSNYEHEKNKYTEQNELFEIMSSFSFFKPHKIEWTPQGPQLVDTSNSEEIIKTKHRSQFIFSCTETTAMKLFGILLEEKYAERKALIDKIKALQENFKLL